MRKLTLIALLAIIVIPLAIGAYVFTSGISAVQAPSDDGHFTITGLSDIQYFNGENVIVRAVVTNDGPPKNVSVSNTTVAVVGNNTNTSNAGTASSATAVRSVNNSDVQTIIAELKGAQSFSVVRIKDVPLACNVSAVIVFDFGQVPVGSYVVTVRVSGNSLSKVSADVTVKSTPLMNEWTSIGDVAFLMDNLGPDSIDVNIRNNGQHAVMFGDQQYNIYANSSDDFGVPLQGLNKTLVWPGNTVTVHATIPHAGSYYLDHFAIAVPGGSGLIIFPWGIWMNATV
jgi:hypothetical protein